MHTIAPPPLATLDRPKAAPAAHGVQASACQSRTAATVETLTAATLAKIATTQGIDSATQLLYDAVTSAPWNQPFLESLAATIPTRSKSAPDILIAPGALYREQPRFGSDGRVVRAAASELGWRSRVIEVESMGSVVANAEMIARTLEREPKPVVLASLSKGGADVRIAIERHPHIREKIAAWLNICGLIRGTPISDSLLGTRWWQRGLLRGYLAYTNADAQFVTDLAATPNSLLGRPIDPTLFKEVRTISVVGFPLSEHLNSNSRARHLRMAHLGPNDGTSLLRDSMLLPGLVCPVWGSDHFLRVPGVDDLLRRLLRYVEGTR